MKRLSHIFLLTLMISTGCRKSIEPADEAQPFVFGVNGQVENAPIKLIAGENNYFMFTSFDRDEAGVYRFEGNLKRNCTNCNSSLRIVLRDYRPALPGEMTDGEKSFSGEHPYIYFKPGNLVLRYTVNFWGNPTGNGDPTHSFAIDGGAPVNTVSFTRSLDFDHTYNIRYIAKFPGGCSSSLEYPFVLPRYNYNNNVVDGNNFFDFFYEVHDSNTVYFTTFNPGGGSLTWDFGDGKTDTGSTLIHQYAAPGSYKVRLTRTREHRTDDLYHAVPTSNNLCAANFFMVSTPVIDSLDLSSVLIEYTDEQGHLYSSALAMQDASSRFSVTGHTPYKPDADGRKTSMLDILATCNLSDGTNTIRLKDLNGRFAVAYP